MRQIGKNFLRFQNAFYVLVTAEAKSKSAIKTNVSQNVLIVGTPVNMEALVRSCLLETIKKTEN